MSKLIKVSHTLASFQDGGALLQVLGIQPGGLYGDVGSTRGEAGARAGAGGAASGLKGNKNKHGNI